MENGEKAATGIGAGVGGFVGAKIGIAGLFGAISGMLPLAIIGGAIGYGLMRLGNQQEKIDRLERDEQDKLP